MHDMPFRLGERTTYLLDPPVRIDSGDVITTTCTFGEDPDENDGEMCFNFAIYYPKAFRTTSCLEAPSSFDIC